VLVLSLPPLVALAFQHHWIPTIPSFLYATTWLVAFVTSVLFVYLYRMDKPSTFVQLYLLSLAVKLIACLAYSVVMIMKDRSGAVSNVLYFLVIYFVFTTLEIATLYKKISASSRS
jgi:hypothetical protein